MAGPPAPEPFRMAGARAVLGSHPGAANFERVLGTLERAVGDAPDIAFDAAKSLIESVCKTILKDCGQEVDEKLDFQPLFRQTMQRLRLVPDGHTGNDVPEAIRKTINGFNSVIQGLGELRNRSGAISHGKDAYVLPLESVQAELAARAADTMVSFMVQASDGYTVRRAAPRLLYRDNPAFNEYVDENHSPVVIFGQEYQPSEVLFQVDQDAYRNGLSEFATAQNDDTVTIGAEQ